MDQGLWASDLSQIRYQMPTHIDLSITHLVINGILGGPIQLPNATTSHRTERHVLKGAKPKGLAEWSGP